ncbi:GTP pyrophosphokinase [Desulfotomaculum arcticum]|uniref:GTP diphosphokinase n=1 Tax=Desulfotruncus arcticus DSM 17038 TaxID=1121424 RepID=A0A1I2ZI87_9FIRM|nr:bifunctional (p)ppGpp synthetase/guanosine-3',5'-bis(diphosphate) 3'-pyrophosphohydrolase [Desulfotruncus arcticus]SFH37567.1 GTP pyrophosphokinase [Desulfotomaculum arcticum] [Desulfotruncus arcticus DSM 17038]
MNLEDVIQKVIHYNPGADLDALRLAYAFAAQAHDGQKRISGEPYINHPLAIAFILADLEMDVDTLMAGMLHDTVEDTRVTLEDLEKNFGPEVAKLVDGVTKLSRLEYRSKEERQVENLRKMFLAMARDIRVVLIKLADRLHNMRTLHYHQEHKQREIALETLEIFAPLAHRLGIYRLKWELEDLAFRFSNPEKYYELADLVARTRDKREEYINYIIKILSAKLKEVKINAEILGRPKNLYSIYQKMEKQQLEFNQIYDVMAVRVLVDSLRDCYAVLGTVHTMWVPIPGRFKDYIAMPKSNMYQSLHTTVVSPQGDPLEIQIRTWEMHRTAEYGIAAHWKYKEGRGKEGNFERRLSWLRQILDWEKDLKDAREFMESLKIDIFADVVFVFTPKGDVIELPGGSTPLDFAYRVHTQVGHICVGAKVNNKIVPLDYTLKNGDRVEVLTSKQSRGPSRDWLKVVKTSQAKAKIRQWFKKEQREENIAKGRDLLEREIKKHGLDADFIKSDKLLEYGSKMNLADLDDVYTAVGDGTFSAASIVNKLREETNREEKKESARKELEVMLQQEPRALPSWGKPTQGIRVRGVDNLLIRLAHCCNPVPGDEIVGYVTRGRGVSIHRENCHNVEFLLNDPDRLVEVAWDKDFHSPFQVRLEIEGMNRAGFLSDIMAVLSEMKLNANWVTARGRKDNSGVVEMLLEIGDIEQLDHIIGKFSRVKDVYSVHRRGKSMLKAREDN